MLEEYHNPVDFERGYPDGTGKALQTRVKVRHSVY